VASEKALEFRFILQVAVGMENMDVIKRFLDNTYPEVGLDCPVFPVMVVLL
jgi:hypothetical protein